MAFPCNEYDLGVRCGVLRWGDPGRVFPPPGSGAGKQEARTLVEPKGGQDSCGQVGGQRSTAVTEQRDSNRG